VWNASQRTSELVRPSDDDNVLTVLGDSGAMANIAAQRIKREFKEVIKSEEVSECPRAELRRIKAAYRDYAIPATGISRSRTRRDPTNPLDGRKAIGEPVARRPLSTVFVSLVMFFSFIPKIEKERQKENRIARWISRLYA